MIIGRDKKGVEMKKKGYTICREANLIRADLRECDLRGADLTGANLTDANLRDSYLVDVCLRGALLSGADLRGANFTGADLRLATLYDAILAGAIFNGADLTNADLTNAEMHGADFRGANLRGADLSPWFVCPKSGEFIAYKKASGCVVKLKIPAWARRVSSMVGRKCRAEYAIVLEIIDEDGKNVDEVIGDFKSENGYAKYRVGKVVKPDRYDPDPRVECSHGIHFFITIQEAKNY